MRKREDFEAQLEQAVRNKDFVRIRKLLKALEKIPRQVDVDVRKETGR